MVKEAVSIEWAGVEQNRHVSLVVEKEAGRLRRFIRRRLPDTADAEDVLQDVFSELVEAYRLVKPIEQVGAWLFRVARNRIVDLLRKRRSRAALRVVGSDDGVAEPPLLEDLLPSPDAGPDVVYARRLLLDELDAALDELPEEQRDVFVAHEIEGRTFRELAAETGLSINTLLARKRYAVLRLRRRLHDVHEEFEEIWKTRD